MWGLQSWPGLAILSAEARYFICFRFSPGRAFCYARRCPFEIMSTTQDYSACSVGGRGWHASTRRSTALESTRRVRTRRAERARPSLLSRVREADHGYRVRSTIRGRSALRWISDASRLADGWRLVDAAEGGGRSLADLVQERGWVTPGERAEVEQRLSENGDAGAKSCP